MLLLFHSMLSDICQLKLINFVLNDIFCLQNLWQKKAARGKKKFNIFYNTKQWLYLVYYLLSQWQSSNGPKGHQVEHHNIGTEPHACIGRNRKPGNSFFIFNIASSMDHRCMHSRTETTNDNVTQHGGHTAACRSTKSCSLGLQHTSLILDMHVMFNWHLSKQVGSCPVSCDHIVGSGLELIEVTCFFEVGRWLTRYRFSFGSQAQARLIYCTLL